ncbi:MAG: pilus assembly protein PilY [Nitrospirae bacterium]|nr:pilus assembly protein PilY [Nitrospirota bacterium]
MKLIRGVFTPCFSMLLPAALFILVMAFAPGTVTAVAPDPAAADSAAVPPFVSDISPPLVMMVMDRDHKLYYQAYDDASDLDQDGTLDVGYNHSTEYYGYFDPGKCYTYNTSGSGEFDPASAAISRFCSSGQWSGNVLNWLAMSRMDALRKVLYGGHRSTDTTSATVLERAYIPQDGHSWGKEFTGRLCSSGSGYTSQCMTALDCAAGETCVDRSLELIGMAAPSAPATCTAAAVTDPWDTTGRMLVVRYGHAASKGCGLNHTSMMAQYEPDKYLTYFYVDDLNDPALNPSTDHAGDNLSLFGVAEFQVTVAGAGNWSFAIDGDDDVEIEIDGVVVSNYYGCHGPVNNQSHSGSIALAAGWHRLIVRHNEEGGWEGFRAWYKKPGDAAWTVFGNTLSIRAPTIVAGNTCALKFGSFIETGTPGTGTGISGIAERHLFCNTTLSDGGAPVFRLLKARQNRIWEWASKERPVCDTSLGAPTDYVVRVKVCDAASGLEGNCKAYINSAGTTTYKPSGILQKYGEGDSKICSKSFAACTANADCAPDGGNCIYNAKIYFGLLTGSYEKNLSGGVVRKNIGSIMDEIDPGTGVFNLSLNSGGNIIQTLERLKTVEYDYGSYSYGNCGWISTRSINEGECRMWGNPTAEMMYEATRYLAGKSASTPAFWYATAADPNDAGLRLPNIGSGSGADSAWVNPFSVYPQCAQPFMLVMSDIDPSYDSDSVPGSHFNSFSGDLSGLDASTLATAIAGGENIGGAYFIGEKGAANDFMCTAKPVGSLSDIRGLCPDEPTKKGSFYSASVAYFGREKLKTCTGDSGTACSSNADCAAVGGNCERRGISTYSVALSSPVPKIEIPFPSIGSAVTLVPVGKSVSGCLNVSTSCSGKCALSYNAGTGLSITGCSSGAYCPSNTIVNLYVDKIEADYGHFRINYEDQEQGADYDMDAVVEYEYCRGNRCAPAIGANQVKVRLNSIFAAGCIDQAMGFVISGTTGDGTYLAVRDTDSGSGLSGTGIPLTWEKTFTASGNAAAGLLNNPLWYSAKWGGFNDMDGSGTPNLASEWDRDGDGNPNTYFYVSNPLRLEAELESAFTQIISRASSGTAMSVLSTSGDGDGAMYQAYFLPEKIEESSTVKWLGCLQSFFVDKYGNIREDTNGNDAMNMGSDYIISLDFDPDQGAIINKYADSNGDGIKDSATPAATQTLENFSAPVWDGGKKLWEKNAADRKILTTINGYDFTGLASNPTKGYFHDVNNVALKPWLRAADNTESSNIINWIRGDAVSGYRSRDVAIGATTRVWKLGDIVYSTPVAVGKATENYDILYSDATYSAYRSANLRRRQAVYVGANDGMLHAFNGGYYDSTNKRFCTALDGSGSCSNGAPELGDELWSFVPRAALPHLKSLTASTYSHEYYVDLKPKVSDVKLFTADATHVSGWGTVLLGGMRYGGKEMSWTSGGLSYGTKSEYFAMDVTDPASPRLLWTFSHSSLGQTMSQPAIVKTCAPGGSCKWFAVFGSGPSGYDSQSNLSGFGNGYVFVLDLTSGSNGVVSSWIENSNYWRISTGHASAFLADPVAVDVDMDYDADVIYIGENFNDSGAWNARLLRLTTVAGTENNPSNWTRSFVADVNAMAGGNDSARRITSAPSVAMDEQGKLWLYFGTGQFLGAGDKASGETGAFYGIKDSCWDGSCADSYSALDDMSSSVICLGGGTACPSGTGFASIRHDRGWVIYFSRIRETTDFTGAALNHVGERVVAKPIVIGGLVVWTTYAPGTDACSSGGEGNLYSVYYTTGSAYKDYTMKGQKTRETRSGQNNENTTVSRVVRLGSGMPSSVSAQITKSGVAKGFAQSSTGAVIEVESITPVSMKSRITGWKGRRIP